MVGYEETSVQGFPSVHGEDNNFIEMALRMPKNHFSSHATSLPILCVCGCRIGALDRRENFGDLGYRNFHTVSF